MYRLICVYIYIWVYTGGAPSVVSVLERLLGGVAESFNGRTFMYTYICVYMYTFVGYAHICVYVCRDAERCCWKLQR